MQKRNFSYLALLLCLILASCYKADQAPTFTPLPPSSSITEATTITQPPFKAVIPNQTAAIRPTLTETLLPLNLTPTMTNAWTPTPMQFIDTYPHKEVWISYEYASGVHSMYEAFLGIRNFPNLVLYADGQLILYNNQQPIQTKMLSPDEICNLFTALESLGLSNIQTNGTGSLDDPIYQNTTGLGRVYDAGETILYINGSIPRHYVIYEPFKDHAVKAIMNIFAFLDQYTPNDLQPYHADRLSVFVQKGREAYEQMLTNSQQLILIPWPAKATPLSQNSEGVLYLEGEAASEVFDLTGGYPMDTGGVFVDEGVEYTVYVKPILPDEWIGDYCYSSPCHKATSFTPSFSCTQDVFK